jgi:flagellar biosynthetic protein FliR
MEIVNFLTEQNVIIFFLLFIRISAVMAFFPFLNHMSIPISVKAALAFYLTIILFPYASLSVESIDFASISLAVLSEMMLGFIAGLMLQIVLAALQLAGEQISFVMGFTMASVIDPQSGHQSPILSQFFTFLAIMMILAFDGHHLMLMFIFDSTRTLVLGGFYPDISIWKQIANAVVNMFILGFSLSFPIIALSLMSDVVFGMLMKTMPQFNLLVVGFPIKIFLSFIVLSAVLSAILIIFKREFLQALNFIATLF